MEQDLPEGTVQGQEEVLSKGAKVGVGWAERALELDPVGIVFAPIVGRSFLTKPASLAITLAALSVGQRW